MPTKTQRLLDLIVFLLGRRFPVDVEQIMEGVPAYAKKWREGSETDRRSVRRMFERDKDELRDLGIPLETVSFRVNYGKEEVEGYRLPDRDFYLPYLKLIGEDEEAPVPRVQAGTFEVRPDEAAAALDGLERLADLPAFPLARDARAAFRKLTFDLDPGLFPASRAVHLDPPGSLEARELVDALSDALMTRKRVRFTYRGIRRNRVTERDVAPYGLLFLNSSWYLVGHDALREAVRTFRVGRMSDLEVNSRNPNTPDYEVPDDFDLADHAERRPWDLGEDDDPPRRVRVLFHFPRSLWAERNGYGELVERRDDGSAVRSFDVRDPDALLRWLLGQEGEAVIQLPAELRQEMERMAERVARVHAAAPAGEVP